jgi:hypothetical protein
MLKLMSKEGRGGLGSNLGIKARIRPSEVLGGHWSKPARPWREGAKESAPPPAPWSTVIVDRVTTLLPSGARPTFLTLYTSTSTGFGSDE